MAHPDDYSDDYPPWGKRARLVPLRTYSGRVVYDRPKHKFRAEDAARILRAIEPPDTPDSRWFDKIIQALQAATVAMLQRLLPLLSAGETWAIYDWINNLIASWFDSIGLDDEHVKRWSRGLIMQLASYTGAKVTIGE